MNPFLSIFLVAAATFTIFAYIVFIWWLDRYEREPIWLVFLTFCWGAFGGTMLGGAFTLSLSAISNLIFDPSTTNLLTAVVFAPSLEEITKALIFVFLIFSVHFDNETDGLIYGAATGLGFACVENLLYFSNTQSMEELATLVVLRTGLTALVHCVSSSLIGISLGFARARGSSAFMTLIFLTVGYVLAVANHATWNGIATATGSLGAEGGGIVFLTGILIVFGGALVMFMLTQFSLWREHKLIERVLKLEAKMGTLPDVHASIIPFWLKRRKSDWLDPKINKKRYVRLATKLAFRKHKYEVFRNNDKKKKKLIDEMDRIREEIQTLVQV